MTLASVAGAHDALVAYRMNGEYPAENGYPVDRLPGWKIWIRWLRGSSRRSAIIGRDIAVHRRSQTVRRVVLPM
jgi:hypothetical protein